MHPESRSRYFGDMPSIRAARCVYGGGWGVVGSRTTNTRRPTTAAETESALVGGDQVSYLPGWQEGAVLSAITWQTIIEGPSMLAEWRRRRAAAPDTESSVGSR